MTLASLTVHAVHHFKNWFHCKTYFTGLPYRRCLNRQYVCLPSPISQPKLWTNSSNFKNLNIIDQVPILTDVDFWEGLLLHKMFWNK